jgi:hypothetical protein
MGHLKIALNAPLRKSASYTSSAASAAIMMGSDSIPAPAQTLTRSFVFMTLLSRMDIYVLGLSWVS